MTELAALLTLVLLVIAGAHAYWGTGGIWPAKSVADLARTVIGDGRTRMPPPWSCFAVAAALAVVAALPWVILAWPRSDVVLVVIIVVSAVFFIRGSAGYSPRWRGRFSAEPFAKLDVQLYSPLCMALAAGFLLLLARGM